MHILFLARTMPPDFGAVGDYAAHLAESMGKTGAKIQILTQKTLQGSVHRNDVDVIDLDIKWDVTSIRTLYKEVVSRNPDVFFVQLTPYSYSKIGVPFWLTLLFIGLRFKGIPVAVMFHETIVRFRSFKLSNLKNNFIALFQLCHIRLMALFVISFTSNSDYAKSIGEKNVQAIIPVGSNILPVDFSDKELEAYKKDLAGSSKIITTFGSNLRNTISLFEQAFLFQDIGQYYFLIIGKINKKDEGKLHQLQLKGNIKINITGFLSEKEVYKALRISDVFVMLFPNIDGTRSGINTKSGSLAAALAAGLPVISQKGYLTDKLFISGENCFLLEGEDLSSYIKQIETLFDDDMLLNKVREGAVHLYAKHLSWDVIAAQFLNHLPQ